MFTSATAPIRRATQHHRMLARELAISKALLRRREAQLRAGLAPFDFGPGAVPVQGYNGLAFTLNDGPAEQSRTRRRHDERRCGRER